MYRTSFLMLAVLVAFSTLISAQPKNRQLSVINDSPGKDEYEIYAILAKEWFGGKEFKTITVLSEISGCGRATNSIDPAYAKIPELKFAEMAADCLQKKAARLRPDQLGVGKKVLLLSENKMKLLFAVGCEVGWKKFYKQYPKSNGQMYFSRVGFDNERRFAGVSFGFQRGCLSGEGYVIFLEKSGSDWRIIYKQSTWMS